MDSFGKNMCAVLDPGKIPVVDEIMSMWLGKDGKYSAEGGVLTVISTANSRTSIHGLRASLYCSVAPQVPDIDEF